MNFQFDEEQQILADSLAKAIERDYDFETRKKFIASEAGHSESMWQSMAEMGIVLLPLSEQAGGFGMGSLALFPVMEQVGRGLLLEPLVETLISTRLLDRLGGESQAELLGKISSGQSGIAFAHVEAGSGPGADYLETVATGSDGQWTVDGTKLVVVGGASAEKILVTARVGSGDGATSLGVFLVDGNADGLSRKSMRTIDNYRAADLTFAGVKAVPVGEPGKAYDAIDEAVDFGTLLLCAEAVGAMNSANDATLEYLKTRKQFGTPIGAFQVLQHRMVDMTVAAEQARSITYLACDTFDAAAGSADAEAVANRRHLVSAAKVKVSEAARQVGQDAIQMHGGMGMTNEMKVSHTFKRLTMISNSFGDVDYHLERFAATGR